MIKQDYPSNLFEVIVVDDDSPDRTGEVVERYTRNDPRVRLIHRIGKKGLPGALWEGIINSTGEYVVWLDADFASAPLTLTRLVEKRSQYDIGVLSRYTAEGKDKRKEKFRVFASTLGNRLARGILGTVTKDLTSGYIIAKRAVFDTITLSGIYGEYCVRFLYYAEKSGVRIKEIPYECLSREKGRSKTSGNVFSFIKYGFIYLFTVIKLRLENIKL